MTPVATQTLIGTIVRLQVQPGSVKVNVGSTERYDPTLLAVVPQLRLAPHGATGLSADGRHVPDIHNATHPATRFRIRNPFSFACTGTYALLRERYGSHMTDGCAGENILIDAPLPIPVDRQLAIRRADGTLVTLHIYIPAKPCAPFARYALQNATPAPHLLKSTLQQLLEDGRGYYFQVLRTTDIAIGDELVAL